MTMGPNIFKIASLPEMLNRRLLLDAMLGSQFMVYHELRTGSAFMIMEGDGTAERLQSAVLGMGLERQERKFLDFRSIRYMVAFDHRPSDAEALPPLWDIHTILSGSDSSLVISFVPVDRSYVKRVKRRIEELVSRKEIRMTRNFGARHSEEASGSIQSELYYDSDERKAHLAMLETLNEAMLSNGASYKVSMILVGKDVDALRNYLRSKMLVLEEAGLEAGSLFELWEKSRSRDALPVSISNASMLLSFPDAIRKSKIIPTSIESQRSEGICLGLYVDGSAHDTGRKVLIEASTLNLGTLVTGLPGSGKTFAAMSIIKQAKEGRDCSVVAISPTEEWSAFGEDIGIKVIRLYEEDFRINFFRCYDSDNKERFYENLAMLVAHASNAGPYKNSMEKCLLSAFNKIYARTLDPDPVDLYGQIEEAVIENHGKRSNAGVKYSKHGENIRAALENLRLMLLKPQFAYQGGMDIMELLGRGIVFDLSGVSNNMKPFFYALILNQVYAFTDRMDSEGDRRLRMLLCLEEAQLIFDDVEQSTATLDLRQRIQDFRKKGIGIMLITHSVTDINLRIRRLCQTKMYFRQSADSVNYAASDLIFEGRLMEDLSDRLKTLDHRVCVANYMEARNNVKSPASSVFLKISEYGLPRPAKRISMRETQTTITRIKIMARDGSPLPGRRAEVRYVGERVYQGRTDANGDLLIESLLKDKKYVLIIFGEKKRDTERQEFLGCHDSLIRLD